MQGNAIPNCNPLNQRNVTYFCCQPQWLALKERFAPFQSSFLVLLWIECTLLHFIIVDIQTQICQDECVKWNAIFKWNEILSLGSNHCTAAAEHVSLMRIFYIYIYLELKLLFALEYFSILLKIFSGWIHRFNILCTLPPFIATHKCIQFDFTQIIIVQWWLLEFAYNEMHVSST